MRSILFLKAPQQPYPYTHCHCHGCVMPPTVGKQEGDGCFTCYHLRKLEHREVHCITTNHMQSVLSHTDRNFVNLESERTVSAYESARNLHARASSLLLGLKISSNQSKMKSAIVFCLFWLLRVIQPVLQTYPTILP